ncbi:MAG: hypothetical protein ACOZAM_30270 [Pseudomonadota bacterium]
MIAHIAKRIAFIVTGYLAAVVVSTVLACGFTKHVVGFTSFYVPKVPIFLPPEYVAVLLALIIRTAYSFLPALVLILIAEAFGWRRLWTYLIGALLVALSAFLLFIPVWTAEMIVFDLASDPAMLLFALSGGFVYWAVAGRRAGWSTKAITP